MLDKESYVRDKNEIGCGRIASIGTIEKGDSEKNIVIYNCEDHTEIDEWANDKSIVNRKLDINDVNLDVDYEELLLLESHLMHEVKRKGVSGFVEEYKKNIEQFHETWDEVKFCFLLALLGCFDKSFFYPEEVKLDMYILNPYVHFKYVVLEEKIDVQELYDKSLKPFRDRGFLFDKLCGAV